MPRLHGKMAQAASDGAVENPLAAEDAGSGGLAASSGAAAGSSSAVDMSTISACRSATPKKATVAGCTKRSEVDNCDTMLFCLQPVFARPGVNR